MGTVLKSGYRGQPHAHLTGRPGLIGKDKPVQQPAITRIVNQLPPVDGSRQWAELHRRALAWPGVPDSQWLSNFRLRVPCGECRKHWDEMLARTPPDWFNYFAWTVARHNEVNERLGKPVMDEPAARAMWADSGPV